MKLIIVFVYFTFLVGNVSVVSFRIRPRIVGGKNAEIEELAYQASLRVYNYHVCGGCIISERHILTAAHCITEHFLPPYNTVSVNTGTSKTTDPGHSHRIAKITVHPGWSEDWDSSLDNDIAIITLEDKIIFDKKQQMIELTCTDVVNGMNAIIAGWGDTSTAKDAKLSVQLQKLKTTVLEYTDCQSQAIIKLHNTHLCAYHSKGRGACFGDSGSPLVSDSNKVIGIFSLVDNCASGEPEVYTNVYAHRDFISSTMKNDFL